MIRLLVFLFGTFLVFSFIHYLNKNKKPFKRAFVSLLCGPLVLIAINVLSSVTNVLVPITELSLMTSVAGGIPGVALLVLSTALL